MEVNTSVSSPEKLVAGISAAMTFSKACRAALEAVVLPTSSECSEDVCKAKAEPARLAALFCHNSSNLHVQIHKLLNWRGLSLPLQTELSIDCRIWWLQVILWTLICMYRTV